MRAGQSRAEAPSLPLLRVLLRTHRQLVHGGLWPAPPAASTQEAASDRSGWAMSLLAAFLGDSLHLDTFQVQRALSVLCQMKPHRRQEARDPWTVKAQGSSCPHAHWQGGAGRPGRQDTVGTQAAIWSETAGSSQKNSASSFPTVLWEPPGIKPPSPSPATFTGNTSSAGHRAARPGEAWASGEHRCRYGAVTAAESQRTRGTGVGVGSCCPWPAVAPPQACFQLLDGPGRQKCL